MTTALKVINGWPNGTSGIHFTALEILRRVALDLHIRIIIYIHIEFDFFLSWQISSPPGNPPFIYLFSMKDESAEILRSPAAG